MLLLLILMISRRIQALSFVSLTEFLLQGPVRHRLYPASLSWGVIEDEALAPEIGLHCYSYIGLISPCMQLCHACKFDAPNDYTGY
ncbi:hypothetical protein BJ508DRAFT_34793 [Ascobolus immersus RN42]|uniref:Uncharacterized protein n=1 Tax=Ascobolus immersus RN42 TaxID=1160509 RepID=A0A3N4HND2_ASCIM|nr:hypothetical protein BJ508DRAFT_34793 [Ascobolus immersus RN42]